MTPFISTSSHALDAARPTSRLLALGGVLGPLVFFSVFTIAGLLTPGYSPWREPISNLGAEGPSRWIQNGNFVLSGLLLIAFALGFWQTMGAVLAKQRLIASTILLLLTGTGLAVASVFPTDLPGFPPVDLHGAVHVSLFFLVFGSLFATLLLVGGPLRKNALWRTIGWYTTLTAVLMPVGMVILFALSDSPVGGLVQRLFELLPFAWYVVLGLRLATRPALSPP